MLTFKENLEITENMKNISKALKTLSNTPAFKKISKQLLSVSKRALEHDKNAPRQVSHALNKLALKVDKKNGAKLAKMGKLAGTYT
jgi:soluble cytochrome b562